MSSYTTKEEIVETAEQLVGRTFGEIAKSLNVNIDNTRGSLGLFIEKNIFGIEQNSSPEPDFKKAGVELKVTPYRINKNGTLSAKERLVLNMINYNDEYKNTFENSHFWHKNKLIEIIWYLNIGNNKSNWPIKYQKLFTFSENDKKIVIEDWNKIIDKIKAGEAHNLSESDTLYLGACPKGRNSKDLVTQPFSNILAMRRAFCLKQSYMTGLVRQYIGGQKTEEIKFKYKRKKLTFEQKFEEQISKYKDKSVKDLFKILNIKSGSKQTLRLLISKMVGLKTNIDNSDQFLKANIKIKTIRVEENNTIREHMSFPAFKFKDIVNESWETSKLFKIFSTTKYLFAIFKKHSDGNYYFYGIKFWNMPADVLNKQVKDVWKKTIDVLKSGNIVKSVGKKRDTNFPHSSFNKICHVRPHGKDSNDTYPLPIKDKLTGFSSYSKQSFWLDRSYILSIIFHK